MGALKIEDYPHYGYDDYLLWDDNWEIINGIAYSMAPMPMIKHQKISSKIDRYLNELFDECTNCHVLLPVDWKINDNTIVQPDNLVICHEPKNEAYISIAPKIIFEILSKSTSSKDTGLKFDLYEKEGVEYYIIVDPNDEVAKVYNIKDGKYIKVCDTVDDTVPFKLKKCEVKFNFALIWG